jgi:hemolysin III
MPKRNRRKEEFWNVVTHGMGTLLSLAALTILIVFSTLKGNRLQLLTSAVFGVSLVLLYSASTIYHAMSRLRWKRIFKKIDHLCIYILIAGTYTPVALLGIRGAWGWTIFGLIWSLAAAGFVFKFSPLRYSEKLSLALYALMGWLVVIAIKPLIENLAEGALWFILAGGLCYTVGIYFYAKEKMPYGHTIWHLFVLAGSAFHFFGIFLYLIV